MIIRKNRQWANTFIAGVPKGGTTALATILAQHADVYVPKKKEPKYYNVLGQQSSAGDRVNRRAVSTGDQYAALYSNVPAKVLIDATPSYYGNAQALDLIKKDVPDARIILLLRDPVERVFSHFWFAVQRGYEPPNAKFEDIFTIEEVVSKDGYLRRRNYVKSSVYVDHLDRLFSLFPSDQIYLTTSERFLREQSKVLEEVCDFLGITRFEFNLEIGEKAKSGLPKSRPVHFLTRKFQRVTKLAPALTPKFLIAKVEQLYNSNLIKPRMSPASRQKLIDYYRNSVVELNQKYSIDTSYWKNFSGTSQSSGGTSEQLPVASSDAAAPAFRL